MEKTIHHGRNVKRFRTMLDLKQDALADRMGGEEKGWNQSRVSKLEDKDYIDDGILREVGTALNIPLEALKNFDEEAAINIVANTFADNSTWNGPNFHPSFNPVDKVVELLEKQVAEKENKIEALERRIKDLEEQNERLKKKK
jgi:transcriptional regulator with XRE-family HTH domain